MQSTSRRKSSGCVLTMCVKQRPREREEPWAQRDGSLPIGAVSPNRIVLPLAWPVVRRPATAERASDRYSAALCNVPPAEYCGLSQDLRFGSFQIDHSLTCG